MKQSSNLIKYYRARCRPPLNQVELSDVLGIAVTTVQNWERDGVPHASKLLQLVEVFAHHGAITEYMTARDFWNKSGRQSFPEPPQLQELFKSEQLQVIDPANEDKLASRASASDTHRPNGAISRQHASIAWMALFSVLVLGLFQGYVLMHSRTGRTELPSKPGGQWISPTDGFVISSDKLHFTAHAYDSPVGPGVSSIRFTALVSGTWQVACEATAPIHDDVYQCDWDLSRLPTGPLQVSFDVYSKSNAYNKAPHGMRHGLYRVSP